MSLKEKFRCSEFGNPNSSDACLQCPSNLECCKEQQKMSGLKQKVKEPLNTKASPKTEPIPWQAWIKSPAYLRLTPKKKIASLLHIIKRKEKEIENLKAEFEKHAWYCIDCDEWHTKGKICAVAEVRKIREE